MKAWIIAWKDIRVQFRDRKALVLMLVAPLALAAIMGAAFGGFLQETSAPIAAIPLVIVNDDAGDQGERFVAALTQATADGMLAPTTLDDRDAAWEQVARGTMRALIYIPPGFSQALAADVPGSAAAHAARIELYTDPSASITPVLVQALVTQTMTQFNRVAIAQQVVGSQIRLSVAADQVPEPGELAAMIQHEVDTTLTAESAAITLERRTIGTGGQAVNPLAYFVPSMIIFFLMFTMFDNTRSILTEQQEGTLRRLMTTSTRVYQIVLGKLGGSFLSGLIQVTLLVLIAGGLLRVHWGQSLAGLALMVVASVAAITSLGAVVAAFAKNSAQADLLAGVITLVSAALGGNFVPIERLPTWLQGLSYGTVNRWSLQGLADLTVRQQGWAAILPESLILLGTALVFFTLAAWQLQRRIVR